jgi:hypothetical protein
MHMPHRPELHESGIIDPDLIASLVKARSGARSPVSQKRQDARVSYVIIHQWP